MTIGILALDGCDYRLATEHDLFRDLDVTTVELRNDLSGDGALFTPRVWTSIFAGTDNHDVTGWVKADHVDNADTHGGAWTAKTQYLDFLWHRVPGTVVQDLNVHPGGWTTEESAMPQDWKPRYSSAEPMGTLKERAKDQVDFWNDDLADDIPILVSYWPFFDRWGHGAMRRDYELAPAYSWFRDTIIPELDRPDEWVIVSDHGFDVDAVDDPDTINHGEDAHDVHGVLAASDGINLGDRDWFMTNFIPQWQTRVTDFVSTQNLEALGYR